MPFAASCSKRSKLDAALTAVCDGIRAGMNGTAPDLSVLFVSHAHADGFDRLAALVRERTETRVLLGCTGETIIGGGEEIESGIAISLWSAVLPGAEIEPFRVEFVQTPDGIACSGLPAATPEESSSDRGGEADRGDVRAVFFLGDPFSSAPQSVIDHFAAELPGVPLLGGMASGAMQPGENRLFLDSDSVSLGGVGVIVRRGPRVRSIVSQGCRPIGTHYVVTKADRNVIFELGGSPPLLRLQEFLPTLPPRDQMLVRKGIHLGLVMNEYQETFERGDFLISNVVAGDRESGAIAIGNPVRVGQTVQFHVRDDRTADEDLVELLRRDAEIHPQRPQGALLFSCNGRGTRLFPSPNHDAGAIERHYGPIPLAGFFAQGELGPVGDKNYMHGYTASIALFE